MEGIAGFAVLWVLGAIVVGIFASNRGANPWLWGFVSLLFSPLFGFLGAWLATPKKAA